MSHAPTLRSLKELGVGGILKELYKFRTIKHGNLIGTDKLGNQYFENKVDYPHGQHRWVKLAENGKGCYSFYTADPTAIEPSWFPWLHHQTDEAPTATTVGSTHRVEPQKNAHGSSAPYARNLGGVISAPYPNQSMIRPRGYGLGNGIEDSNAIGSAPGQEAFYTQPGHPLDKRNSTRFTSERAKRVGFTLRDTPLTLQAKAAARTGLSLDKYQLYTDDSRPTKALLQLTGGSIGSAEAEQLVAESGAPADSEAAMAFLEAAAGIPSDAKERELAVALATNNGTGYVTSFAQEASALLTAEEQAVLQAGLDASQLLNEAAKYQKYIDDYKDIKGRDITAALEKVVVKRDAALAQVKVLERAEAKLAALADKYDAEGYRMAKQAVANSEETQQMA